ncbi:MAG: Slp family lipoprotein [Gammaproteobacteria bacterium]|jgi:outer membrane lipoprotein
MRLLACLSLLLLLAGCESVGERDTLSSFTPADAILDPDAFRGRDVAWGGTLIATTNRSDETLLEILSYPLGSGWPRLSQPSNGRVLARIPGFLDPADYRAGRTVVVEGLFTGVSHSYTEGVSTTRAVLEARKAEVGPASTDASGWPPNLHIGIGFSTSL